MFRFQFFSFDALTQIQNLLEDWHYPHTTLDLFTDGDALIHSHLTDPFDIILLDVMMPLINGIDTAKEIRNKDKNVKIVFLTSSIEYAFDSYSVKASDYLLKPINKNKLFQTLSKLCQEIKSISKTILIASNNVHHRILIYDIEMLEAQNKRVLFTLKDGPKFFQTNLCVLMKKRYYQKAVFTNLIAVISLPFFHCIVFFEGDYHVLEKPHSSFSQSAARL